MTRSAPPLTLPSAVVFDLDGVLVASEEADWESWRELYDLHGLRLTLDQFCVTAGRYGGWETLYDDLTRRTGVERDALHTHRLPRFLELVQCQLVPQPALVNLLDRLDGAGIRTAVASASDLEWIEYVLGGLGIRDRLMVVVSGDECSARKPDPACYLRAAEALGVAANCCVAVEDSATGIEAAVAAAMAVIAVPNRVTARQDLARAHRSVSSLEEIDEAVLAAALSRRGDAPATVGGRPASPGTADEGSAPA